MRENIETLTRGKWRVTIFQRSNGTYGLDWEQYSDALYEHCWILCRQCETFCDSLDTARREAIARLELQNPDELK